MRHVRSKYGVQLCVIPGDVTNEMCILGYYSDVIPRHIRSLPSNSVFLDIGANQGLFSLLASAQLMAGVVLAFEPNPKIFPILLQNIQLNKAPNIVPMNLAFGEQNDVLLLELVSGHSGASRLLLGGAAEHATSVRVPVVDPATFPLLLDLIGRRSVHVKIDVEGFELHVLRALLRSPIAAQIHSVVAEIDAKLMNEYGHTPRELYKLMFDEGFEPEFGEGAHEHYDDVFSRRRPLTGVGDLNLAQ